MDSCHQCQSWRLFKFLMSARNQPEHLVGTSIPHLLFSSDFQQKLLFSLRHWPHLSLCGYLRPLRWMYVGRIVKADSPFSRIKGPGESAGLFRGGGRRKTSCTQTDKQLTIFISRLRWTCFFLCRRCHPHSGRLLRTLPSLTRISKVLSLTLSMLI